MSSRGCPVRTYACSSNPRLASTQSAPGVKRRIFSLISDFSETLALFNCRASWLIFLARCRLRLISLRRSLLGKGLSFGLARCTFPRATYPAGVGRFRSSPTGRFRAAAPPAPTTSKRDRAVPTRPDSRTANPVFLADHPSAVNQYGGPNGVEGCMARFAAEERPQGMPIGKFQSHPSTERRPHWPAAVPKFKEQREMQSKRKEHRANSRVARTGVSERRGCQESATIGRQLENLRKRLFPEAETGWLKAGSRA